MAKPMLRPPLRPHPVRSGQDVEQHLLVVAQQGYGGQRALFQDVLHNARTVRAAVDQVAHEQQHGAAHGPGGQVGQDKGVQRPQPGSLPVHVADGVDACGRRQAARLHR